jgi:hypothetical protein
MQINSELLEDFLRAKRELREAIARKQEMDEDEWDIYVDGFWDEFEIAWYALLDEYDKEELIKCGLIPDKFEEETPIYLSQCSL